MSAELVIVMFPLIAQLLGVGVMVAGGAILTARLVVRACDEIELMRHRIGGAR